MSEYHKAVLLEESVTALITNRQGLYLDLTFGGGGHSKEILNRLGEKARLISFDRDSQALENEIDDPRFKLIHNNFRFLRNYLIDCDPKHDKEAKADGIIADLGVSSHQFDTAQRGFSFRYEAELDMRMNDKASLKAKDILNDYDYEALKNIFKLYGELENAAKIAQVICKYRENKSIDSSSDLYEAISGYLPKFAPHKYLAKLYQALRIEVNQEMKALEYFLKSCPDCLKEGGRLVVISYHSLEDRMVKNFMKCGNIEGRQDKDHFGNILCPFKIISKKAILPSEEEIRLNTRARSAKLRVAERVYSKMERNDG